MEPTEIRVAACGFVPEEAGRDTQREGEDASGEVTMPRLLTTRLCVLFFLGFAILGAWVPVFTLHLNQLQFTPEETSWAAATSAIALLIAPLLWGQIADRWLAAERCISLCALVSCLGLFYLATLTEPWPIILGCLFNYFFLVPVLGLTSSYIFRQLEHPEQKYGNIRLWGTLGWVAASWCLTLWLKLRPQEFADTDSVLGSPDLSDSFRVGAVAAFVLAIYALTLPHAPPQPRTNDAFRERIWLFRLIDAPMSALHLFRDRSFVIYSMCMFGVYVTMPFTTQLNPLLLKQIEVDAALLPSYLTIAQGTEVLMLAILPMLLMRMGMKKTMLLGNTVWTIGLIALAIGFPTWLVFTALASHGIFICCFLVAGQVFVNRQATHDIRASAQGLLLFISGTGMLLGHLLVGWIRESTNDSFVWAYLIAAYVSEATVLLFLVGFKPLPTTTISPKSVASG